MKPKRIFLYLWIILFAAFTMSNNALAPLGLLKDCTASEYTKNLVRSDAVQLLTEMGIFWSCAEEDARENGIATDVYLTTVKDKAEHGGP